MDLATLTTEEMYKLELKSVRDQLIPARADLARAVAVVRGLENKENALLILLGQRPDDPSPSEYKATSKTSTVLDLLRQHPEGLRAGEVWTSLHQTDAALPKNTVYQILLRQKENGRVERRGDRYYCPKEAV